MASESGSLSLNSEQITVTQPPTWARVLLASLEKLETGRVTISHGNWQQSYGSDRGPQAHIVVLDPSFYQAVLRNGSIGAAEAYMDGLWESPDLVQLIRVMAANATLLDQIESGSTWFNKVMLKLLHRGNRNSLSGSKKNIEAHYDLSNAFYQLFLDDTMMYSSGVFPHEDATLKEASEHKLKRLCDSLELTEDDHLLEIGTGWGGLACYAAKHYGCKVTSTTISQAQFQFAQKRVEREGLTEQITLLTQDYRELKGQYDKLISIEMIEAVGYEHLPQFFAQCNQLLKAGGKMALQSITIACQREPHYRNHVDFIQRYIFPGGYLPSLSVLSEKIAKHSSFTIRSLDDIGLDYAQTLKLWRDNFEGELDKVKSLGFDERFVRMWRYYLCYCEGGFREKAISTVQVKLEKALHY